MGEFRRRTARSEAAPYHFHAASSRPELTRRAVLGGLLAPLGIAALPAQSLAPIAASDPGGSVVNVRDFGARGDGTTDDSAAVEAAFDAARSRAQTAQGDRLRIGLPRVYFPSGTYYLSRTLRRAHESGLTIEGDGPRSTVLRIDKGIPLLELHRCSEVVLRDMTFACGSDLRQPWLDGLVEGSAGVLVHERNDDTYQEGNVTNLSFVRCEWIGFHRACCFYGNQMGDNVTWVQCKWVDNFIDFDYTNGQSMNHRVVGGEVLAFVGSSEASYDARLAIWSPASRPPSAKSGPTRTRDGAVVHAFCGGGTSFFNVSFIAMKTTLLFGQLPRDVKTAVYHYGVALNLMAWVFDNCSWEMRAQDTIRDRFGLERIALLRFENPWPVYGDRTQSPVVRFLAARVTLAWGKVPRIDLFCLSNGASVFWLDGSRALKASTVPAYIVSCTSPSTASNPGRFVARNSSVLARKRTSGYADHQISQV